MVLSGYDQKGARLCEMPHESWEITYFATLVVGVRGISNTPSDRDVSDIVLDGPRGKGGHCGEGHCVAVFSPQLNSELCGPREQSGWSGDEGVVRQERTERTLGFLCMCRAAASSEK